MNTRTIGTVNFLLPGIDQEDLSPVADPPSAGPLTEAFVTGGSWDSWRVDYDVRRSRFVGAVLVNASFHAAAISGCAFERVDLSGSQWTSTTLERTVFKGCRLLGAHFISTKVKDVIFEECRLDYATLDRLRTIGPTAFLGCTFTETTVTNACAPAAIFDRSRLTRTEMIDCDLRDADLRGCDLTSISGVASLAGARVTQHQLIELLGPLVRDLRLQVERL